MKKVCKILLIFIMVVSIYLNTYTTQASDIWSTAKDFIKKGAETTGMTEENTKLFELLGGNTKAGFEELIDFLWGLGLLAIFLSTVILGIKYMLVSPAEKSKIKQATTPYILGVVIIFGAVTIWRLVIIVLDGSL